MCQGNSGKLCRTTCLPPIAILEVRFSTLIFASCQIQSPSAGAVIKDGSDTYQRCHSPYTSAITCTHWHILKCAHVLACVHTHTHADVSSLCSCHMPLPDIRPQYFAWWTHSSGLCSWKMEEYEASLHHCKISPAHRKGIGWEAHIIVNISVINMHPSSYFDSLVCFQSSSTVYRNLSTLHIPVYNMPLHTHLLVLEKRKGRKNNR